MCRLRQIKVHPDIAFLAVCHHWTKKTPSLPKLEEQQLRLENAISKAHDDLRDLSQDLAKLVKELKQAEDRWLELSELES